MQDLGDADSVFAAAVVFQLAIHPCRSRPRQEPRQVSPIVLLCRAPEKELTEWICRVWDIAKKQIKAIVPEDAWPASEARLNGFQGAYGTVLLYEDQSVVKGLQDNIPLYAEHFPICESRFYANSRFYLYPT